MKIKLDENIAASLANLFSKYGVDTETVYAEGLQGSPDNLIYQKAQEEGRILVTCDLDFADIRKFPPSASGGIVVLRLLNRSLRSLTERLEQILKTVHLEDLKGAITIVSENNVRLRR